jgi:hypothetical protein
LAFDHDALRAGLARAVIEPGPIGEAATRVARLCRAHFAKEEENVSYAFGLLHDLESNDVRPNKEAIAPMIAHFSAQHLALRGHHQSIHVAIEELLQEARNEGNIKIAELVHNLRYHEKIENEVVYPTMLFINNSVRQSLVA